MASVLIGNSCQTQTLQGLGRMGVLQYALQRSATQHVARRKELKRRTKRLSDLSAADRVEGQPKNADLFSQICVHSLLNHTRNP